MKQAVSISIGSSKRDKEVEVELLNQTVRMERRGTDGDMQAAARLYTELDGRVDAFGVGGTNLGFPVGTRWYPLYSIQSLVKGVKVTPLVDGTGLKMTLERQVADLIDKKLGNYIKERRVLLMSGIDRSGLMFSFLTAGYQPLIGDLMFALGIPVSLRSERSMRRLARVLLPVVNRLPFRWIYPVGESQEKRTPKFISAFQWASVIAGDCHYITRYMPDDLESKVIVTNTTTTEDRELFRQAGVKYLITTTPMYDQRSFGTNMLEAGIVAAWGRKEHINYARPGTYYSELDKIIKSLDISPQFQEL